MEKQRWEELERRRAEERRSEKRKCEKKEGADCVFPMICGSGGSKSRLAKAAGAEPSGHMRDEKLHAVVTRSTSKKTKNTHVQSTFGSGDVEKVHTVVAQSTFQVKMHKAHTSRSTFGSWDVEKVHAVLARSTFPSQSVQNTYPPVRAGTL